MRMVKYTSDVTLYRAGEGKKNQMIKKDNTSKQIRIYCLVVGIISFFIVSVCGQLLNRNTVNEEKMRAAFTAETTVNRIRSQLNRYLDVSEFFQNIIGSGHQMDSKEFQALSQMISDDSQIIKVIEQAPDGVVKDIYPLKGNEAAFGIDMLNNPARKHEANLAMKSGQYTIAGPYELNQGALAHCCLNRFILQINPGKNPSGDSQSWYLTGTDFWKNWNWISLPMLPTVIRCGKRRKFRKENHHRPGGRCDSQRSCTDQL